jgi:hypothetical protein
MFRSSARATSVLPLKMLEIICHELSAKTKHAKAPTIITSSAIFFFSQLHKIIFPFRAWSCSALTIKGI